ncbi:MAG: hypothetical protein RBG1_1C00001G0594 [candidate division Zixibacteria bacterium RBG-1]|nr:MAG: hypothetical protein RBG1_1C00001G0594 [candidate division Zixibacteria bacterium RBG-1]OGC85679.1 MAG: hypothetical protein A2V73_08400 [candidate division Zixibacteria bacterium RBG_19FT_COMBO_42_43]
MKYKLFSIIIFIFAFFTGGSLFAQTDPGIRDTLFVDRVNGRLQPNTSVVTHVWGYYDEGLGGISIPLKYKNPQTDVTLDSIRFHPNMNSVSLKDSVRNDPAGTVMLIFISFGVIPAGTDTFAILYFTTGPSWDPAVHNPIDTFYPVVGISLSYVDTSASPVDITPHYLPPGNLDVRDDNSFPSTLKPNTFVLSQNYPNPFNTETVISFALPKTGHVKLEIYNILGQKVKDLVDEMVTAGYKKVVWDGRDNTGKIVASGVYLYQLKTGGFTEAKRMNLLK